MDLYYIDLRFSYDRKPELTFNHSHADNLETVLDNLKQLTVNRGIKEQLNNTDLDAIYQANGNVNLHEHIDDSLHPYFLNKPFPADIAYKIANIIKYPNFISAPVHVTVNKLMKDHYLNKSVWRRVE